MRCDASATSSAVVVAPNEMRNEPSTTCLEAPIAVSTGDGSLDPLAHAEPINVLLKLH